MHQGQSTASECLSSLASFCAGWEFTTSAPLPICLFEEPPSVNAERSGGLSAARAASGQCSVAGVGAG